MQGGAGAPSTYYGMTVAATQQFGKTTVNSRGSKFGVALGRMFDQEVLVTYDGFETALDKYWSGAQVRMTHAFRGVFGTPALPVGSCCITNDDAGSEPESESDAGSEPESESESDVEF